jgi:hypothetical protein
MTRFVIFTIFIFFSSIIAVSIINALYSEGLLSDIFNKKINFSDDRRIINPQMIRIYEPTCILTGTSRVARGFGPENYYLKKNKCMNLYFNAGNINEINQFLKLALRKEVKEIFLGIDFFSFNKNFYLKQYQSNFNEADYIYDNKFVRIFLNIDQLLSLRNLRKIFKQKNFLASFKKQHKFEDIYNLTFDQTNRVRKNISLVDDRFIKAYGLYKYFKKSNEGHGLGNFQINQEGLYEFLNIIENINSSNSKIYIFLSPVHNYLLEAIHLKKLDKHYYKIIEQISNKTDSVNSILYDFSDYNYITDGLNETGRFVNGFYLDFGHYSKEVGNLIIDEIKNKTNKFGVIVNHNNFLSYKLHIKSRRDKWNDNNILDKSILNKIFRCKEEKCVENIILEQFELKSHSNNKFITNLPLLNSEIFIPKGEFHFGLKDIHRSLNGSKHQIKFLKDYYIDAHEVTNKDFYNNNLNSFSIGITNDFVEDLPVTGITFEEAKEHCKKIGKRLPTEEEWEKAVKGDKYYRYSWGNIFPVCDFATFNGDKGIGCGLEKRNKDNTKYGNLTSKVLTNKLGVSDLGAVNLMGNVWEYIDNNIDSNDVITKGGGWSTELIGLNSSSRYVVSKNSRFSNVGFRCARD